VMRSRPLRCLEAMSVWCITAMTAIACAQEASLPLPPPENRESISGVDIVYTDTPVANGDRVRLIVTRPQGAVGPLPVVFVAGWLSCDSVNWPKGPPFGYAHAFFQIARESGYMTVRMEKPGVGDSRGPRCAELDFQRELAAYRAAFTATTKLQGVDSSRIVILGLSNGGGFAPLVPQGNAVAGYVVVGGWVKTWYEHMLEHERRRLALAGSTPGQINAAMADYATFYQLFLIERLTPGEVIRRRPELKRRWYDADSGQYGRPAAFFQQLQALNLAEAWSQVKVPALVIHGEYDWIMSAEDHRMIAGLVAKNGNALATFVEAARTNHVLEVVPDERAAFEGSGPYNADVTALIVRWLRERRGS
jgi:pimeloyl-ACP methyl ester carboxylesterase